MNVKIKKLNSEAIIPTKGSNGAAGLDLYSCIPQDVYIMPHTTLKIPTGIAMAIPSGYFGGIFARSGFATKEGIRPATCVSVIDEDYRGEIIVPLHNDTEDLKIIPAGERIAQIVFAPYLAVEFEESDTLDDTERGDGGFGSTGQ